MASRYDIGTCMCVCACVCACVRAFAFVSLSVSVSARVCVSACVCVCVHARARGVCLSVCACKYVTCLHKCELLVCWSTCTRELCQPDWLLIPCIQILYVFNSAASITAILVSCDVIDSVNSTPRECKKSIKPRCRVYVTVWVLAAFNTIDDESSELQPTTQVSA